MWDFLKKAGKTVATAGIIVLVQKGKKAKIRDVVEGAIYMTTTGRATAPTTREVSANIGRVIRTADFQGSDREYAEAYGRRRISEEAGRLELRRSHVR